MRYQILLPALLRCPSPSIPYVRDPLPRAAPMTTRRRMSQPVDVSSHCPSPSGSFLGRGQPIWLDSYSPPRFPTLPVWDRSKSLIGTEASPSRLPPGVSLSPHRTRSLPLVGGLRRAVPAAGQTAESLRGTGSRGEVCPRLIVVRGPRHRAWENRAIGAWEMGDGRCQRSMSGPGGDSVQQ